MRIKLPHDLSEDDRRALMQDLRASVEINKVEYRNGSLIIEHSDEDRTLTLVGEQLSRFFPGFQRLSDEFDARMAKAAADPWINKSLPLGFVGLAVYTAIRDGAILAGESAFALAYIAFDIYWKFQQEKVIRKIEQGMSRSQKAEAN
jgi:hypothetical protein